MTPQIVPMGPQIVSMAPQIVPTAPMYRPANPIVFQSGPRPVLQPQQFRTVVSMRSPVIAPDSKFVDSDHVFMV